MKYFCSINHIIYYAIDMRHAADIEQSTQRLHAAVLNTSVYTACHIMSCNYSTIGTIASTKHVN
jgi:hypothetical protein